MPSSTCGAGIYPRPHTRPPLARCGVAVQTATTGLAAQWIRHRPTEPGIAGSSPAEVNDRTCADVWWRVRTHPHVCAANMGAAHAPGRQAPSRVAAMRVRPQRVAWCTCLRARVARVYTTPPPSASSKLLDCSKCNSRPRGPMDKASAHGAGDCRFESGRSHCGCVVGFLFMCYWMRRWVP